MRIVDVLDYSAKWVFIAFDDDVVWINKIYTKKYGTADDVTHILSTLLLNWCDGNALL